MLKIGPFFLRAFRFWPPFLGAGISVKEFKPDCSYILVQMKLRYWNQNYIGTHFGGSLYSMTDPFYMLMLLKMLGKNYIIWDKAASIRYLKPARGTVYARFEISPEQVAQIKQELEHAIKVEPKFEISITDSEGTVVAVIEKTLHVKLKQPNNRLCEQKVK